MAVTLNGWLGYSTSVQFGQLVEPTDTGYFRRPLILGDLYGGRVAEVSGGTVGPAITTWGSIGFAGVYDASNRGNLLFWWPLQIPVSIMAGMTLSTKTGDIVLYFPDLSQPRDTQIWPPGVVIAQFNDGRSVSTGTALQYAKGVFSAQSPVFGATITMAQLPQVQPTTGTGLLWNNGGVISIA